MADKKIKNRLQRETTKLERLLSDMDAFIGFARMNIDRASDSQLEDLIGEYPHLLIKDASTTPFQDYAKAHARYFDFANKVDRNELRRLFYGVQLHLRTIMNAVANALQKREAMLLEYSGTIRLVLDKKAERFVELFIPRDFHAGSEVTLATECALIESRYAETVRSLVMELPADRFKVCQKCGIPFFQKTEREKLYCSSQCAVASAQRRYAENKRK